jgi:hydroxyacid-oxoacid transhydrogenase
MPFHERQPRPENPINRREYSVPIEHCNADDIAAYQGSNPISDIFSKWALEQTVKYLPRISADPTDDEARAQML